MHQNMPVPRFKLSSFSHFVTTASSYPKPEPTALRGRRQKGQFFIGAPIDDQKGCSSILIMQIVNDYYVILVFYCVLLPSVAIRE